MPLEERLETVFVYGTLLAEEVTKLVLNRVPASETGMARSTTQAMQSQLTHGG